MKFSENSNQAADFLRQAVPKMVKHNIVPNPLNYTLWYSYFSNAFPLLNKELDHTLERYGTCSPEVGEALFLQHMTQIGTPDDENLEKVQIALSHMVSNLSQSFGQTAENTRCYSSALKLNIDALKEQPVGQPNEELLGELTANSEAICAANDDFQHQLDSAQDEINRLRRDLENSRHEATTDQLTGLYNRRVLEGIYQQHSTEEEMKDMSVIIMDIDKFKVFNDTHGHLMGDQILKVVGALLKKECQKPVTPVRFGGEEFALLCPTMNLADAQVLAEKIRSKLSCVPFSNKRTGQKIPPVTASFGVALKRANEVLNDLMDRADTALYMAKNNGRDQVQVAI